MRGSKRVHESDSSDTGQEQNVTPVLKLPAKRTKSASDHVFNEMEQISQSVRKRLSCSIVLSPLVNERNENGEQQEREERHRQRIEAKRKSLHSSTSTPDKRKTSSKGADEIFNPEQLKEHYSVCIKLSATNKITTKNAFVLHLIDYMSDFLKNTTDGQMNFKLASSTLDAGAKIYCSRVDCVHDVAQKVASGLVMAFDKKSNDNGQPDVKEGEHDNHITKLGSKPKKQKALKSSKRTLVQNIDTINAHKIEGTSEIDPLFHHISSGFDVGNVNCLLTSNLRTNDNYQLILDSESRINDNIPVVRSFDVSYNNIIQHLSWASDPKVKICPKIADFVFANRSDGSNLIPTIDRDQNSTIPDLRASATNSKSSFVFDINAEVEEEINDVVEDLVDDMFGENDCNSSFNFQRANLIVRESLTRAFNLEGMIDLIKILSDKPTDYSYFNKKLLCTWAGPEHWKANPFSVFRRNGRNLQTGAASTKKTRVKKQDRDVDFSKNLNPKCEEPGKNIDMKVVILEKWTETRDNLLPDDYCYCPKSLTIPFIKPYWTVGSQLNSKDNPDIEDNSSNNVEGYSVPGSPEIMDGEWCNDHDEVFSAEAYGETNSQNPGAPVTLNTSEQLPFSGKNLVSQPEAIEKIDLNYDKVAKKMDVKRLKRAMWDVLTETPCSSQAAEAQNTEMYGHISFSELYKCVPRKITQTMVNNLSVPIAFVTLLHLNLRLIANLEMTDFEIFQQNGVQQQHWIEEEPL